MHVVDKDFVTLGTNGIFSRSVLPVKDGKPRVALKVKLSPAPRVVGYVG